MRTWMTERMEREEKKRLADEARERKQLALEAQPRRRSGRLAVSVSVFVCRSLVAVWCWWLETRPVACPFGSSVVLFYFSVLLSDPKV